MKKIFIFLVVTFVFLPLGIMANFTVNYGMSIAQNKRPYQEDRFIGLSLDQGYFFGVYDGHGGDRVSSYLKDNLHKNFLGSLATGLSVQKAFEHAFMTAEQYALDHYNDGSTALAVYIDTSNKMYCAWTGDTRAVLEQGGVVGFETKDHKPNDASELARIENHGGYIQELGVWRVGGLAVSRAIGDRQLKSHFSGQIIAVPEYKEITLHQNNHFLIIASDGLWDVVSSQQAVEMVKEKLPLGGGVTPNIIAQELQNVAIDRGSQDNIAVSVIVFNWAAHKSAPLSQGPDKQSIVTSQQGVKTGVAWLYDRITNFVEWLKGDR